MTPAQSRATLFLVYAIAVHAIDCLATREAGVPIDWTLFDWRFDSGFDAFKFLAWLVIPLALAWRGMDWGWLGVRRWKRMDLAILGGLCVLGAAAIAAITWIPALRAMYPSMGGYTADERWQFASFALVWLASWLIGWEFLHRCVLARAVVAAFPGRPLLAACLIIPTVEAVYHVGQGKGLLESAAVFVFGILLTAYTVHRRNALLPFLAHLFVELALVAYLLLL